jgi:acyl-CoA reductase-like NAD-dependent aldehyde dehydrogenase
MLDTTAATRVLRGKLGSGVALSWIDGAWVDSDKRTDSFDPATGDRIGSYADASQADAAAAIQAAVRAFESTDWKENRQLRAKVLNQIADRFESWREDLIDILSLENGKIRGEAAFEVDMIPSKFRFWASVVLTDYGRALEVLPGRLSFVTRSPIGVAGIIAPFNSPLVLTVRSLAPALAAGVTTVIWTRDIDRPLRVAREIDAGTIWLNDWAVVWDEFEEGGFKRSGNGRLNGLAAMDEFLEYKHIAFNTGSIEEIQWKARSQSRSTSQRS